MSFQNPWHLTVIRTRGLVFLRPEKSWRPIVNISVMDDRHERDLPREVVLGCDGQNPNLKSTIPINDVNSSTRIIIQVFHRSHTRKKHRKRTLVGSASVSVTEFLNKHPLPHPRPVEHDVRLSCPPPQRKSPTISGRQQHHASLTMMFHVPQDIPNLYDSPPMSPVSENLGTDDMMSDGASSSRAPSDTLVSLTPDQQTENKPWGKQPEPGLRRRKKRLLKGFHIDSDSDTHGAGSSSEEEYCDPPTPGDDYFLPIRQGSCYDEEEQNEAVVVSPSILPMHTGQGGVMNVQASLSFVEACVDRFAPYHELREAEEERDCVKADRVLGRLLTEWYVVGASLLGLAGIDAAVFGFASGSLFAIEGFSRGAVSIGAIAAGIGLVCDAWFLVLYSGADAMKFQRCAKDVYNSYFFFCLTCRLPTVCMFISALSLMAFLLAVAWTAWPTAVLVMSFVAGFLLTSQFLVFGVHLFVNLIIWVVRVTWRKVAGRRLEGQVQVQAQQEVHVHSYVGHSELEMPVPRTASAPAAAAKMDMACKEYKDERSECQ